MKGRLRDDLRQTYLKTAAISSLERIWAISSGVCPS